MNSANILAIMNEQETELISRFNRIILEFVAGQTKQSGHRKIGRAIEKIVEPILKGNDVFMI